MKLRLPLLLLVPLILAACATPKPAQPTQTPQRPALGPDDDHRLVPRQEFHAGPWEALPKFASWKALPGGAAVTLADGRELQLTFVGQGVVRYWVPAAAGDQPLSPAARYAVPGPKVLVGEADGVLSLDTPTLALRWNLADLTWILLRGDKTVLRTSAGPQRHARRLKQAFVASDAVRWGGPGLEKDKTSVKTWAGSDADGAGPVAAATLFAAGGTLPVVLALDSSYQNYVRVSSQDVDLGALNGGLDLLVSAAPQAASAVEALTAITGRPPLPPLWAFGTALALPPEETGAFVRRTKLPIQTAAGPFRADRVRFQSLIEGPQAGSLPDLTRAETRQAWFSLWGDQVPRGAGVSLAALSSRDDWNTVFEDGGRSSSLASMNNRLPGLEATAVAEAWSAANPGLRPLVLATSVGWGTVRGALPEIRVVGDDGVLLSQVLAWSATGLGTPAVRLDLTGLAVSDTRKAAFQRLLSWLMVPVLILDWGSDPAAVWASLSEADQKRLKAILDRRSQFKPLFDQVAHRAAAQGVPAWAPLWFSSSAAAALSNEDEFLLGDLLVAPVAGEATRRSVYLPGPGVWFDFWSGEEFGGGQSYDVDTRADRPLLFARGGAFVPQREPESFDDRDLFNPLIMHVFPGGRGSGLYSLDDGISTQQSAWATELDFDFTQKEMTLDHQNLSTGRVRPDPYLLYRLHNVYRPRQVKIDGKAIPLFGDSFGVTDTDRSAAWYENDHTLLLKTFRPEKDQTIQISF